MLLLDVTHTSHTRACTGIQRVVRSLHAALGAGSAPVCFDGYARQWRVLNGSERAHLAVDITPARRRSAQWPLRTRLVGRWHRWTAHRPPALPAADGLVVPELFSPAVAGALPALFARVHGPRVALFHDALALQYPELAPAPTVARFPAYLRELLMFDGIAAVSAASRDALVGYWKWAGFERTPPILVLPHGISAPVRPAAESAEPAAVPTVLCVGSIEPRKNHLALLEACEQLWREGTAFELHLIGLAAIGGSEPVLERIRALQAAGHRLRYDGPVDDDALESAYARCHLVVYPSLAEGFGLPVAESLVRGKPCICSARGALGEIARDGGCLGLDRVDAPALAQALRQLLTRPAEHAALAAAARQRRFHSWADHVHELEAWMRTLPGR